MINSFNDFIIHDFFSNMHDFVLQTINQFKLATVIFKNEFVFLS